MQGNVAEQPWPVAAVKVRRAFFLFLPGRISPVPRQVLDGKSYRSAAK